MSKYITLDSGKHEQFETGAKRDTQDGKPRYDLIPVKALRRVADVYTRGAVKYLPRNWESGMPYSRFYASALRHIYAFAEGEDKEDNLAACIFNLLAIMEFQERGRTDLDDMPKYDKVADS